MLYITFLIKGGENMKDNPEKIIMIVNGEPIEMCLKTISLSNKRAQNTLRYLKKQSMSQAHTLRFFWGDVVMLNIITNRLLQDVDPRDLARVLKPTESLQSDLDEYRGAREKKVENLKEALIIANDKNLPLDYSRELEKYFKDEYLDKKDDNSDTSSIDMLEEKLYSDITEKENKEDSKKEEDKKEKTIKTNKETPINQKRTQVIVQDDDFENVVFSSETPTNNPQKTQPSTVNNATSSTIPHKTEENKENSKTNNSEDEFNQHMASFNQFSSIDINSLFSGEE